MYVLGLAMGHNSTACLLKDGKIVACVSEERFRQIKNVCGYPANSIKWMMKEFNINMSKIDKVVLINDPFFSDNYPFTKLFIEDYKSKGIFKRTKSYLGYKFPSIFRVYKDFKNRNIPKIQKNNSIDLKNRMSKIMRVEKDKIIVLEHHKAHAYSTCFNLKKDEKTLIFTLDGEGPEGLCATVNIFDGKELSTISETKKEASLGYFYAIATIYLGMKPLEHEFKVMGLAPYAKRDKGQEVYKKVSNLVSINDNLEFKSKFNMPFADNFFNKELKYCRFDNVAYAVQKLVEEKTKEWIKKAINSTGIHNIALAGGVFMNVKANQIIYDLPEVKSLFIMPSCGDESNPIGACFFGYKKYCEEKSLKFQPFPIEDLYLGPEYGEDYIQDFIEKEKLNNNYLIKKVKNINLEVAKLLAKGEIVARCSGRSEWGARALGNRSILSDASNQETIRILNETIKDRDFWMPFTPSILDTYEKKYIVNPKELFSPYMVITFNSTLLANKDLPAAMHPYDKTIRPQIVTKKYNKDYYEIINHFSKLTGRGGILNTSFNLHGRPNVLTPEDAIYTVKNSSLKFLAMGDYLFEKK
jgi:carbamoyltransferase